ncbi:transposase family protein [Sneathiella limimaris]|uniref:transposase family protein n=1 Tax=Sneathiella limimaris TaxID=1964213 RepID=UPI003B82D4CB
MRFNVIENQHSISGLRYAPGPEFDHSRKVWIYEAETTHWPDCPNCERPMHKHRWRPRTINDMPIGAYPAELQVKWHGFRCNCLSKGAQNVH